VILLWLLIVDFDFAIEIEAAWVWSKNPCTTAKIVEAIAIG
jgi:hypothetical protein